ncbi:MAG: HAD family hydrolase [Sphingobacteriales bacterium]|nr:MAG: HAD family hydrolase [Sphingobacteriales bacterium]
MNIFFDLDGTLIDSRKRLYQLFCTLMPASAYSFDEYWAFKKKKQSHRDILTKYFEFTPDHFKEFERNWLEQIELEEWLSLDEPVPGVFQLLKDLKRRHKLYLVTARQSISLAHGQIEKLNLLDFFEKIFVTEQKIEKFDLIRESVKVSSDDWFVGDTGKDIETGKLLGIRTAAVLTGFLSEESLLPYKPDVIIESVLNLKDLGL